MEMRDHIWAAEGRLYLELFNTAFQYAALTDSLLDAFIPVLGTDRGSVQAIIPDNNIIVINYNYVTTDRVMTINIATTDKGIKVTSISDTLPDGSTDKYTNEMNRKMSVIIKAMTNIQKQYADWYHREK